MIHLRARHHRGLSACGKRTTRTTFDGYRVRCRRCQQMVLKLAPQVDDK